MTSVATVDYRGAAAPKKVLWAGIRGVLRMLVRVDHVRFEKHSLLTL